LLRCVLRQHVGPQEPNTRWFLRLLDEPPRAQLFRLAPPKWRPVSPRLSIWAHLFTDYFKPRLDRSLTHHLCVRSWCNNRWVVAAYSDTPTHHERLEAALQLRDWARGKIAPRKLKLLLGSI